MDIYFDGGSRGNGSSKKCIAGCGFVIKYMDYKICGYKYLDDITNNQAEYCGLIEALTLIKKYNTEIKKIIKNKVIINIYGDSLLIIKQLKLEYKVSSNNLINLYKECVELINTLKKYEYVEDIKYNHIYREVNKDADKLANEAMDKKTCIIIIEEPTKK